MSAPERRCPDDGTCHHGCDASSCYRVRSCGPLSGVYERDEWPLDVRARFDEHYDVSVAGWDFHRQVTVRAGIPVVERVGTGEHEHEQLRWPHTVNVSVSPTGRSVRVFVDGVEFKRSEQRT